MMWQLFLLLLVSIATTSPMILSTSLPWVTSTSSTKHSKPAPTSVLLHLVPPANISACEESNYCNNGECLLVKMANRKHSTLSVSCRCNNFFVDSEAGLCTVEGKSQRVALLLR